jgi:fucose permease
MSAVSSAALIACTAAFVVGLLLALPGWLRHALAERLNLRRGRVDGLLAALNLALIPMMLLSGTLIDTIGVRTVLILGALICAVAVFGLTVKTSYLAVLGALLALGAGIACLSTGAVVLMPQAFGFSVHETAASLNLGFVFFSLGALVTPTLADLLMRTARFEKTMAVLALLCLVPALVAALTPLTSVAETHEKVGLGDVLAEPYFWIVGSAFLLYAPLEFAFSAWGLTYLTGDQQFAPRKAAWLMSLFWLAFVSSRVLMTALFHWQHWLESAAAWFILGLAAVSAGVVANLAGEAKPRRAAWELLILGFVLGPIFPTLAALTLNHFPANRGTAFGALFAVGSLGSLVLAPLLSMFSRGHTTLRALRLLAPLAMLLVVVALALALR